MNLSRTYRWICKACPAIRSFSYADTAEIAAKNHVHFFGHTVSVEWWANYKPHTTIYTPKKVAPRSQQGRLFS